MSLNTLATELGALEPSEVRAPKLPMAVVLQEAAELVRLCAEPAVCAALVRVGQPRGFLAQIAMRLEAAREAEAEWALQRKGPGRGRYRQILIHARQLRRELLSAARYHLRRDRSARACLARIGARKDVATLVQDLDSLAHLLRSKGEAFAADATLDAEQAASQAEHAAQALSRALAEVRDSTPAIAALATRNRAFTLLSASVREIRAAGRYAFRHDPDRRSRFASRYRRRKRPGPKASAAPAQTPTPAGGQAPGAGAPRIASAGALSSSSEDTSVVPSRRDSDLVALSSPGQSPPQERTKTEIGAKTSSALQALAPCSSYRGADSTPWQTRHRRFQGARSRCSSGADAEVLAAP